MVSIQDGSNSLLRSLKLYIIITPSMATNHHCYCGSSHLTSRSSLDLVANPDYFELNMEHELSLNSPCSHSRPDSLVS